MRLRSFTAPTIAEAMRQVRVALGADAIIVSTSAEGDGRSARVTAAIEPRWGDVEPGADDDANAREPALTARLHPDVKALRVIRDAFDFHGVPAILAQRLSGLAGDAIEAGAARGDPVLALAASLDKRFRFAGSFGAEARSRPLILVGPPGAGKTATVAKLATRAVLAGKRPGVITADTVRAGGVEQLSAFTRLLDIDIQVAEDPGALADAILAARGISQRNDGVLVDTAGVNPYDEGELARLKAIVAAAKADVALVMPAGGDPLEAAELATAFAEIGAAYLLVTRLDAARRFASLLTAAEAGKLAFCEVGTTPHIADGLALLNPVSLARILLGDFVESSGEAETAQTSTSEPTPTTFKAVS